MAATLATVVVAVIGPPGPQDDPDAGRQRPGLLIDVDEARVIRGLGLPGDPLGRRPVLLLFDRRGTEAARAATVRAGLPEQVALIMVVPETSPDAAPPSGVAAVADPGRRIADAVGLSVPKDGGFPTGYVLIDRERRVRYATLDPGYAERGFEVHILAEALL